MSTARPGLPERRPIGRPLIAALAAISFCLQASLAACQGNAREADHSGPLPVSEELPDFPFPAGVILYLPESGSLEARTLSGALAGRLKMPDWQNAVAGSGFPVGPFLQPGSSFRFAYLHAGKDGLELSMRTSTRVWQVMSPPLLAPLISDPQGRWAAFSRLSSNEAGQIDLYMVDLFTLKGIQRPLALSRRDGEGIITPLAIREESGSPNAVYVCWRSELQADSACRGMAYFDLESGDRIDLVRHGDAILALSPDLHWCLLQASDSPGPAVRLRHLDDGAEVVYSSLMTPGSPLSASLSPTGSRMAWLVGSPESPLQADLVLGGPGGLPPHILSFPELVGQGLPVSGRLLPTFWLDERHLLLSASEGSAPMLYLLDADSGAFSPYQDGLFISTFYRPR
jgi:hypothetical protein